MSVHYSGPTRSSSNEYNVDFSVALESARNYRSHHLERRLELGHEFKKKRRRRLLDPSPVSLASRFAAPVPQDDDSWIKKS